MPKVLEIPKEKSADTKIADDALSWKVELPNAVKRENNLSENSYLVLTVHRGKISGELTLRPNLKKKPPELQENTEKLSRN